MADTVLRSRTERRRRQRVRIGTTTIARFGAAGVLVFDLSDGGSRVEHFAPFSVGRRARFRLDWSGRPIETDAMVVSCRLHRFVPGKEGGTVYQSGLSFVEYIGEARHSLEQVVESLVVRSLAEQVANARGLGPVLEREMPVFRSGVVVGTDGEVDPIASVTTRLGASKLALERGFIRCTLLHGRRWERKWTTSSEQPADGFTMRASESAEGVERLCETYLRGNADDRRLIRLMAQMSVEPDE
jgi:hypothetical protein